MDYPELHFIFVRIIYNLSQYLDRPVLGHAAPNLRGFAVRLLLPMVVSAPGAVTPPPSATYRLTAF